MGLAGPGAADEDCVALGVQEGAGSEFAHLPFIDRRIGEDELVDIVCTENLIRVADVMESPKLAE
jgi:hypothetical protein